MTPLRATTTAPTFGALAAGLLMATQSRVIGGFESFTDNGTQFLLISYTMVVLLISAVAAVNAPLRRGIASLPMLLRTRQLRWYQCLGGALGAWFAISATLTVPRLGLALSVVCTVSGVFAMGIIVDALGLGPGGRKPPTVYRAVGAAIALLAVTIEVAPEIAQQGMGSATPLYSMLALSAGLTVAVQQAFNGRVATATGHPIASGWLNYVTCSAALAAVLGATAVLGIREIEPVTSAPLWFLTPGLLGIGWVALSAWAVGTIGVLRLALLSVSGQILAAFTLDLFNPMVAASMEARTAAACALALCAAFVTTRVRRRPEPRTS